MFFASIDSFRLAGIVGGGGSRIGDTHMSLLGLARKVGCGGRVEKRFQSPRSQLRKTGKVTQTSMFASPYCLQKALTLRRLE